MNVLITGGSGFIGENIAHGLRTNNPDWKISIVDIQPPDDSTLTYKSGDIFEGTAIDGLMEGIDLVYHMVGMKDAGVAQRDPFGSFRLNVQSLGIVLDSMRRKGVRRLIFPSSAAVYGNVDTLPIPEFISPRPTNTYSWHKLMCELQIQAYHNNYGIDFLIYRLFNVYGHGSVNVLSSFLLQAKDKKAIKGFGGMQYRDFIHIDDVVSAFISGATLEQGWNKPINIGSGHGITIREVAKMAAEFFPGTMVDFQERDDFIPYHLIADISVARELLGFNPASDKEKLRQTMKEMIIDV
jgi:UDP-glucose 4-epimerase